MAEIRIDPLRLARWYGFKGETEYGRHIEDGMRAPWDAIKRMAWDRAILEDENEELRNLVKDLRKRHDHQT